MNNVEYTRYTYTEYLYMCAYTVRKQYLYIVLGVGDIVLPYRYCHINHFQYYHKVIMIVKIIMAITIGQKAVRYIYINLINPI